MSNAKPILVIRIPLLPEVDPMMVYYATEELKNDYHVVILQETRKLSKIEVYCSDHVEQAGLEKLMEIIRRTFKKRPLFEQHEKSLIQRTDPPGNGITHTITIKIEEKTQ